jgi:mRNA-degrading endonuclease HigB of HigAB toxin-antitoxin module
MMVQGQDNPTLTDMEMNRQFLFQLKNSTDPQKWNFIEEIKALAEQQNNFQYSTMEAIINISQKSLHDLFYIKYDLSLNTLIATDLLINFRDIRKLTTE